MTPLRQRMIREMELRRFAQRTVESYLGAIIALAAFYRCSPDELGLEDVRWYLHHLVVERKLSQGTCNLHAAAITFLFRHVLGRCEFDIGMRRQPSNKLPEVFSQEELIRLFDAATPFRHRVLLMTTYAAGLRLSEVIHLKPIHIHSERMVLRVEQGKGRKDRYTVLSPMLLHELRRYWQDFRPGEWLFPNRRRTGPMLRGTAQNIFYAAKRRAGLERGRGIHTLRHCFATHLLEAGVDLRTIQVLMGHKNLNTTTIYLHLTHRHLAQAQSSLDLLRTFQARDVPNTPAS
jgi:integrase/recombinase XerD